MVSISTGNDVEPPRTEHPPARPIAPKSGPRLAARSCASRDKGAGNRWKWMTALIPVLVLVLVVLLKNPPDTRSATRSTGRTPPGTGRRAAPDVEIAWALPVPYEPVGRDPMRPIVPEVPEPTLATSAVAPAAPDAALEAPLELTVTGILYSQDKPAAIVDTQIVHVGEQVSGATVEKIEMGGVHFERKGRRWIQTVSR